MAKGNDKISKANYLAVFGLAAIGVVIFFGSMFDSADGRPTQSIITAVAAVVLLGGALFLGIKAKSADNNPDKWRYIEWLAVAAYVVIAVLFAPPFIRFFYVAGEKEALQQEAKNELNYVYNLHRAYDEQRSEAITRANQMLIECKDSKRQIQDDYIKTVAEDPEWAETALEVTAIPVEPKVKDLEIRVEQWDLFDIAKMANDMDSLGEMSLVRMKDNITRYGEENMLIPVIKGTAGGGEFKKIGLVEFTLPEAPKSAFTEAVRTANGVSVLGIIVYVLLNCLVLLNLLVTSRSNYVAPGASSGDIGGTAL